MALNNLQWLICHKTQPNQITYLIYMYKEDSALYAIKLNQTKPNHICLIYMFQEDLALNILQWLMRQ